MKKTYRFIRLATAIAGVLCLFGAAGTDQRFSEMGQMPPESVENLLFIGLLLLIPAALHILREKE